MMMEKKGMDEAEDDWWMVIKSSPHLGDTCASPKAKNLCFPPEKGQFFCPGGFRQQNQNMGPRLRTF